MDPPGDAAVLRVRWRRQRAGMGTREADKHVLLHVDVGKDSTTPATGHHLPARRGNSSVDHRCHLGRRGRAAARPTRRATVVPRRLHRHHRTATGDAGVASTISRRAFPRARPHRRCHQPGHHDRRVAAPRGHHQRDPGVVAAAAAGVLLAIQPAGRPAPTLGCDRWRLPGAGGVLGGLGALAGQFDRHSRRHRHVRFAVDLRIHHRGARIRWGVLQHVPAEHHLAVAGRSAGVGDLCLSAAAEPVAAPIPRVVGGHRDQHDGDELLSVARAGDHVRVRPAARDRPGSADGDR